MTKAAALLFLCLSALAAASAPAVSVDEAGTRVVLRNRSSAVSLALTNSGTEAVPAEIRLTWLSPDDAEQSVAERKIFATPGKSETLIPLPLTARESDQQIWYRLRYRVHTAGGESSGIIALSQICGFCFSMTTSSTTVMPGRPARIAVYTGHPYTHKPVAGVLVKGSLDVGDKPIEAHATTDANGFATLEFAIPADADIDSSDVDAKIEGTKGDFHQLVDDVRLGSPPFLNVTLQTDKPIYQPEQTLHIRALSFDAQNHAKPDLPLVLTVRDPEDITAFVSHVTTNRFGVASADWQIPANLRLGDYTIRVEGDENQENLRSSNVTVRISRYDLPEFRVTAKPDRTYYLPGQNPKVEISANYLFGKPVPAARVRVVRETDRTWNYKLQKWDIEEGESHEGGADANGRFTATLSLGDVFKDLDDETSYGSEFKDTTYTTYATDPLTNRTEQRRFDVRATLHEIHIYLHGGPNSIKGEPIEYFVSTVTPMVGPLLSR